jgi:hypothetical protein
VLAILGLTNSSTYAAEVWISLSSVFSYLPISWDLCRVDCTCVEMWLALAREAFMWRGSAKWPCVTYDQQTHHSTSWLGRADLIPCHLVLSLMALVV